MKKVLAVIIICLITGTFLIAEESDSKTDLKEEIQELKELIKKQEERIEALESSKSKKDEVKKELDEHTDSHILHRREGHQLDGLRIGVGSTMVVQGTENAYGPEEDVTDGSHSVDLELEKGFDENGEAFVHLETGDGAGVDDELNLISGVNYDADDADNSVALTEVWYSYHFKSLPVELTGGKIDPTVYLDDNDFANDETTQFLGILFRDSPTITYPDNAPGFNLNVSPSDFFELNLMAMDAGSDWEDIADTAFLAVQLKFTPEFNGKAGNYRIYGWQNDLDHLNWNDVSKTDEEGTGIGISVDQMLTQNTGVFARFSMQDSEVYLPGSDLSLENSWTLGFQIAGNLWGRENDTLGMAYGQIDISEDFEDFAAMDYDSENHFEVYYNFFINDHLTISPEIQVVEDAFAEMTTGDDESIFIGGVRLQIDF